MKILVINHYAGSIDMGMEYRHYYMGREWCKSGHEVTILCASFAHVRKSQPDVVQDFQEEDVDGIKYVYLKTPQYQGNGIRRILNMLVFVLKLLFSTHKISRTYKPDVVIASSTYPLDNFPAKRIAGISKGKYVYEVHDLWPLSPIELGGFSKHHPFIKIMQWAENYACKNVDLLISMLPKTLPHLEEHGLDTKKWHYIPNGVALEDWTENSILPAGHLEGIEKLKIPGCKLIGYTGSIGLANAMDNLINAAQILKDKSYEFVIVGNGPEKSRLIRRVKEMNLSNIHFLDPVAKVSLPALLQLFDALYIGWQKVSLYRFGVSPNKLLDYMMAAKPVIHAIEAGNDLVAEAGCGISCEPENPVQLAESISSIFNIPATERIEMGENGKRFIIKNHSYFNLSKMMSELFL